MKDYESIKSKLKKLLALAENGIDGEAHNARELLNSLCEQYEISVEELLDTEKKEWRRFKRGTQRIFKDLFLQCYCCVVNTDSMSFIRVSSSEIKVELTAYQYAELLSMFNWHKENLKKDIENIMESLLISYCDKHDIMSHLKTNDKPHDISLTLEEVNRLMALDAMKGILRDNYYHKQLQRFLTE